MQTVLGSVLPRRAEVVRREALDDTRVVLVNGARQLWMNRESRVRCCGSVEDVGEGGVGAGGDPVVDLGRGGGEKLVSSGSPPGI